jgi:hypothetical protein
MKCIQGTLFAILPSLAGDVGVSPGTAITGFPPGMIVSGMIHAGDAVALQAQIDIAAAL